MSKGGNSTQTTTVDPATQAYVNQQRQYAMGSAGMPTGGAPNPLSSQQQSILSRWGIQNPGSGGVNTSPNFQLPALPSEIQQAMGQYGQYAQGGAAGFGALTGNAANQQQFMNPYLSQMNPFFAQQRAQAVQGANDQATLDGAFGGDRSGIAAAQAGNMADQNQAGFNYQGFQDSMQRALQASQMGFGAIGARAFMPQQYRSGQLGLMQQGMGPYGQTQTQQMQGDPFSTLLGIGSMFLPGGGLAGLIGGGASAAAGAMGGGGGQPDYSGLPTFRG